MSETMSNLQRAIFLRFMNKHKALVAGEKVGKGRQATNVRIIKLYSAKLKLLFLIYF